MYLTRIAWSVGAMWYCDYRKTALVLMGKGDATIVFRKLQKLRMPGSDSGGLLLVGYSTETSNWLFLLFVWVISFVSRFLFLGTKYTVFITLDTCIQWCTNLLGTTWKCKKKKNYTTYKKIKRVSCPEVTIVNLYDRLFHDISPSWEQQKACIMSTIKWVENWLYRHSKS